MKKIVVIGAVAGGATVASQIRYYDQEAQIVIFDQDDTMSYGACGMPYFISGEIEQADHLIAATPEDFKNKKNIEVHLQHRVTHIDRQRKVIEVFNIQTQQSFEESYDALILSPGGTPIVPETPGLESTSMFSLRNFSDMKRINDYIQKESPKSCVIVGAGFIGLEMAESFTKLGLTVSIVEKSPQVMNIMDVDCSALVEQELQKEHVHVFKDTFITNVNGRKIDLDNGETIEADFILMSIGVAPSTELAIKANLTIGETKGIQTNEYMQTNDSFIYAIGDAAENIDFITGAAKRVPLAWPAHRQAYIVAKHLTGEKIPFKGLLGTSICKVFSQSVALTGLNKKTLTDRNISFETIVQKSKSNAGYYPDHAELYIVIHFDPVTRKVLGAQAVGGKGVDKRIDVLSTAIYAGLTMDDLQALELAYAPPYSSPKDPVNMVGYRAT